MSTARIVSLVIASVGFVAAVALFGYASSLSTITVLGGQLAYDHDAAQQASTLKGTGGLLALAAIGAFAVFVALTVRDRKRAESA